MKLLKKNPAMVATLISGILILLGWMLKFTSQETLTTLIFLSSFIIGGFKQAKEGFIDTIQTKQLNVDILMVLAAVGASIIGYWMEGALLIFIFSLSGSLEEYATNKSTEAIASLMNMQPETALKIQMDGVTKEVPIESLSISDLVFVPKGASIPIDGTIEKGNAIIDEAAISGEPLPVEKTIGEDIFGGTINLGEGITLKVSKDVKDTLFAKIIRLVEEAQNTPSKTASMIKKLENFSQIKAIAFDKTGTLTKGKPVVTDFYFSEKCNREELINVIVAVEKTSTHPLAKAIVTSFEQEITTKTELHAVQDHTGHGLAC